jgi:hypothetical protein
VRRAGVRRSGEVEQVHALGFVELEGAGDAVEDVLGDTAQVPALEAHVVLGRDAREHRHLLSAESLHPAVAAVRR